MDEEDDQNSRGAYENMERPNVRPNFVANSLGDSARNFFRSSEESAKNTTKDISEKATGKIAGKAAETALNAATGGVGGTVLKTAEKAGVADKIVPSISGNAKGKAKLKKAMPTIIVVGLIVGSLAFGVLGSTILTGLGKVISALFKEKDTSVAYNHTVSDFQINNAQLGNVTGSSEYGDTVFNDMGFSDYQIAAFKRAGLDYAEVDGTKALVHTNYDGSKTYYVSDSAISGYVYADEAIGDAGLQVTDSGAESKSREERIAEIATTLGVAEESNIEPFSNIKKNFAAKNEYIAATDAYRGGQGAWGSETADKTQDTLGINLNTWKDWEQSSNEANNKERVIKTIANKTARNGGGETKSVSVDDLVKNAVEKSNSEGCGYDSAAMLAGSVVNAAETVNQTNIGAALMESVDKNAAGFSPSSPMSTLINIIAEAGGLDTESMHYLFSGSQTKINQNSEIILDTNAQANLGETGNENYNELGDAKAEAETCIYVNNTNSHGGMGFIETVRGMFTKVKGWITSILDKVKGAFSDGSKAAISAIQPAVNRFNKMLEKDKGLENADKSIGEVVYTSIDRITNKIANSVTATMPGDTGSVKAAYREQQEVIAEKAEYDRTTKSPFDISSRHTFLGSIAYSLIPFAISASNSSLSSTISSFSSILKNAATSILPTSSALSEVNLSLNYGDCIFGNSVGAFATANCVNPQTFDKQSASRVSANIFDEVANMRKDEGGYVYGINRDDLNDDRYLDFNREEGNIDEVDANEDGRSKDDVDYGNGPLNPAESDLPSHWGKGKRAGAEGDGEPHGCESDWQYEIRYRLIYNAETKKYEREYYRFYHFNEPSEWKYSRVTNFEYKGYKTGYPNLRGINSTGKEGAKNDEDPGACMLDLKKDNQKQPVINLKGALYTFIQLSGQRTSELGVSDQGNASYLASTDFIHGRINPCIEAIKDRTKRICTEFKDQGGWEGDTEEVAKDAKMSRWVSGSAYVNYNGADTSLIKRGYQTEDIFKDPTRDEAPFRDEMTKYSAYISLVEWMSANGLLGRPGTAIALERYYKDNPLDNSFAGIIARYSGHSKETVVAVLDLFDYIEFLANYDPTKLYPLAPKEQKKTTFYTEQEIIAAVEPIITSNYIVYDELRNHKVTA